MFGYNHKKEANYQLLQLISQQAQYFQNSHNQRDAYQNWYRDPRFDGRTEYYVAEFVSRRGADINCRDALGNTPLLLAIAGEDTDTAQMLVNRFKADVSLANKYGETPLMLALSLGQADVAQTLLLAGAKADAKNQKKETAADVAAQSKVQAVLDLIPYLKGQKNIEEIKDLKKQQELDRSLFRSSSHGYPRDVAAALAQGANPNTTDDKGRTPLMVAYGQEAMEALIAKGAKIDTQDNDGKTALMYAAENGKSSRVDALLKAGADPTVKDNAGKTAAEYTADNTVLNLLEDEVIKRGGNTPALIAAREQRRTTRELFDVLGRGDLIEVPALILAGADPYASSWKGQNALTFSIYQQQPSATAVLLAAGVDVNKADGNGDTPLYVAFKNGRSRTFNALLKNGASPDVSTPDGETILHAAIARGQGEFARMLIENKADITVLNKKGETALKASVMAGGQADTIKALANAGVDINERDADGNTLLMKALREGRDQTSWALLEAGADVTTKNAKGESARDISAQTNGRFTQEIKKREDAARDKRIVELEDQVKQLGGSITKPPAAALPAPSTAKPSAPQ